MRGTLYGHWRMSMSNRGAKGTAFMWCGNPKRWDGSMDSYVADPDQYVYWATPPLQCSHNEISQGKKAYIWRTTSAAAPRGIIAVGTIEERPRQYSASTAHLFAHPQRLQGGEEAAS